MFEAFPKLTRFSHGWTVTEKIDGTNAQVLIVPIDTLAGDTLANGDKEISIPNELLATVDDFAIFAGSRKRLLTPGAGDNHGSAGFVQQNAEEIVAKLGEGRHFGEWYGKGIGPRQYGLNEKRFALFNTFRWTGADLPNRMDVVPVIGQPNSYVGDTSTFFADALDFLKQMGSRIAPGFDNPEGIVMHHGPSGTLFKKTFEYDEQGKWAENEERRNAAQNTV